SAISPSLSSELPSLLPVVPVTEALLRLRNGPRLLTCLVGNMPDQLDHVLTSLLVNGETQDEVSLAGRCRTTALSSLLHLHPPSSPHAQSLALLHHKHPTLALSIALSAEENPATSSPVSDSSTGMGPGMAPPPTPTGVVTLLHNIIITGDDDTKAWFSQYMKLMQQKYRRQRTSAVTRLRKFIMKTLLSFTTKSTSATKPSDTNEVFVAMETDATAGQQQQQQQRSTQREVERRDKPGKSVSGEGVKEKKKKRRRKKGEGGEGEGGETTEGDSEIEMDTALELVDQMEIEVSDGDGEPSPKVPAVVSDGGGGGEREKGADTGRSRPKSALATEVVRASGGKGEGGQRSRSRRRHSSGVPAVDFPTISEERQLSDRQAVELMSLLHVCCGLKNQSQMYLTTEETSVILSLIVCSCPPYSPAGVHFIQITLATLLACPFLIGGSLECEKATERWLQWLLDKLPEFDKCCGEGGSYGEMLLLIAIHLREKQLPQLEDLTSNILGMKVTGSRSGRFSHLRQIFLRVFTEEVVCLHAVSVPPTSNLSASLSSYLPVHCVHQLLKTKTFRKHSISITDWVYRQLLHLSEPLHPTLPPLLVEFVNSILLPSSTHGRAFTPVGSVQGQSSSLVCHTPFSAEEILRVYRHDDQLPLTPCSLASQLMILYYVLLYQDTYNSNLKTLLFKSTNKTSPNQTPPRPYSPAILAQIPVKQLLLYAGQNHAHYSALYPSLLRLTATHLPQLCLVEDWLKGEEHSDRVNHFLPLLRLPRSQLTPAVAETVLSQLESSPSRALVLLSHLTSLPPPALPPYCHALSSTLPLLLSPSVSRRVQEAYLSLWTKLNLVVPRRQWHETVGSLRPPSQQHLTPPTHAQLTEDPFTVLQCDRRVFRCPPVLEMLLRVLAAYTSASRAWLLEKCHAQNCITIATSANSDGSAAAPGRLSAQERKELCVALTAAQESAMVQFLLEMCLPNSEEEEKEKESQSSLGAHFSVLREVQCLICSYLHQVFIAEPEMVKLVHFQGYPATLLPVMVTHVPSMHICLKFIPELVTQPQTDKQQFGVLLASFVVQQYPLPEALSIVDEILKFLLALANEIPSHLREDYFTPLLPALVRFCQTFPLLCQKPGQLQRRSLVDVIVCPQCSREGKGEGHTGGCRVRHIGPGHFSRAGRDCSSQSVDKRLLLT
ncbi:Integrator complex subunit 2, partial [Geodia barretti]